MTVEEMLKIIAGAQPIQTSLLAIIMWACVKYVPKFLNRLEDLEDAMDTLSALTAHNIAENLTDEEFEQQMALVRAMRRRRQNGSHKH